MRLRAEETHIYSGGSGHFRMKDIVIAAKDVKTWLHGWLQFCCITPLYGQSFRLLPTPNTQILTNEGFNNFLPIILKDGLGYSTLGAQYLTIPGLCLLRCSHSKTLVVVTDNMCSAILGCNCLHHRSLAVGPLQEAVHSCHHLHTRHSSRVRVTSMSRQARCGIFRLLPDHYGHVHHRWQ